MVRDEFAGYRPRSFLGRPGPPHRWFRRRQWNNTGFAGSPMHM
jgi:hypothetical protein